MKSNMITTLLFAVVIVGWTHAQTWEEFIDSQRGDTVVVRSAQDMMGRPNTLLNAIELDENPPEGRVYELKRGGIYWQNRFLSTPADRPLRIVGQDFGLMVQADDDLGPPIIARIEDEGVMFPEDQIFINNDFLLKNVYATTGSPNEYQHFTLMQARRANITIRLENVYMEHNNWVFVQSNDFPNNRIHISDSYFVNMSGNPCRRDGGVYDAVANPTDEIIVENSTHIMAEGMQYKFRDFPINRAFFNHNTFVNISGQLFTTFGYQVNWIVANNLFVNANVQGYMPGLDKGETDQDELPHGIINVNHLPAHIDVPDAERKILVDRNGVFWDSRIDQIVETLIAQQVNGTANWYSQAITMNERTAAIFADNDRYPRITEGTWIFGGDPNFVDDMGLMSDGVDKLVEYSIRAANLANASTMPKWRHPNNPAVEIGYIRPDWPVPVDLSYTNEAYLTAGLGGFPLGDLNWFPEKKEAWEAVKDDLYAELEAALNEGRPTTSVREVAGSIPSTIYLSQNYPNPFNPTTQIEFSLPEQTTVTLEVFDITGRHIATLLNGELNSGNYLVTWNATDQSGRLVSSGVYFYRLQAGNFVETRRMVFLK